MSAGNGQLAAGWGFRGEENAKSCIELVTQCIFFLMWLCSRWVGFMVQSSVPAVCAGR